MKNYVTALSSLILFQILATALAAGPIFRPTNTITPNVTGLSGFNELPPPAPTQVRVWSTTIQLLFRNYPIPPKYIDHYPFLQTVIKAQKDIIKAQQDLINKGVPAGAAPQIIVTPNQFWRFGKTAMTLHVRDITSEKGMTYSMLSDALQGILDFVDNFGVFAMEISVIDDGRGYVGDMQIGVGITASGNSVATE